MVERTIAQENAVTALANERIKAEAKLLAQGTRDALIITAQGIYTNVRKDANDAYDVDIAALEI